MIKSCGAVIYFKDKYLVIKQLTHWGFPKGKIEPGEKEKETAIREINEEVGLKVNIISGFREETKYKVGDKNKKVVFFLAESKTQELKLQPEEITDAKWLSYEEALKRLTHKSNKLILQKANEYINKR